MASEEDEGNAVAVNLENIDNIEHEQHDDNDDNAKQISSRIYRKRDSLELEAGTTSLTNKSKGPSTAVILQLAFQSLGIVYGDIGTSPLYVYSSIFPNGIKHNDDILGVLSLIFYTLTLIPLLKYVFFVLKATDNGEVGLIPNQQVEDTEVSNYQLEYPKRREKRASFVRSTLENSDFMRHFLLFSTMLGTSMVMGDGVLTPCMSVLSAVGGIKHDANQITEDQVVWISVVILIAIFMVQRFGTDKVGYSFAPIICIWFAFIASTGLYNFIKHDPSVIKALNPKYIIYYFKRNKKEAWISLGGVVLAITGCEALFADVGHFTVRSIQISMCFVTYPTLVLAYTGQAAFLRKHNDLVGDAFYKSIPGIAVVLVMSLTSALLVLIMIMIWKTNIILVICYVLVISSLELTYLSSVLYKFTDGGYLPVALAVFLMLVMFVWNNVYRRKYYYELNHKITPEKLKDITSEVGVSRLPGLAMFYSELVQGIPPIFKHFVENIPALHSVLVFVSIKSLPISRVPNEERFLFRRVQPKELNVFRCVVRYGYIDVRNENEHFEKLLIENLMEFIVKEYYFSKNTIQDESQEVSGEENVQEEIDKELEPVEKASKAGVVHLIGKSEVMAGEGAGIAKKILIDYAYDFLKRNLRQSDKIFDVPHERMVKVGVNYEL
ncbi:hypothetical protein TSUD_341850 [Trifolium subterraneum]|nr:hypothetical protein TSUD_341850 [Trifolium subterraneum]